MKKFRLTLITENQNSLEKGNGFAELVCENLNCKNGFEISNYKKFPDSYRIEIIGEFNDGENSILNSIELTDQICSPWIMKFHKAENEVELMFNKNDNSIFRNPKFNVLRWANFEIEE